jgi:hypothetical protein
MTAMNRGDQEELIRCLTAIKDALATTVETIRVLHQVVKQHDRQIDRIREFIPPIE